MNITGGNVQMIIQCRHRFNEMMDAQSAQDDHKILPGYVLSYIVETLAYATRVPTFTLITLRSVPERALRQHEHIVHLLHV